jgi:hypothetical protein
MKQVMFIIGLLAIGSPAFAFYPHGHDSWRPHQHFEWAHPYPVQFSRWHEGYWHHGYHEHRLGWWWVAGGGWHFYAAPTYPYPTEPPPTYIVQVPVPAPAPLPPPPPPPAPAPTVIPHLPTTTDRTLFFCASANAYFPYVTNCAEPWDLQQGQPAH